MYIQAESTSEIIIVCNLNIKYLALKNGSNSSLWASVTTCSNNLDHSIYSFKNA